MPPIFRCIAIALAVLPTADVASSYGAAAGPVQPATYTAAPPAESRSELQAAISGTKPAPETSTAVPRGVLAPADFSDRRSRPAAGEFPPLSPSRRSRPNSLAGKRNPPGGLSSLVTVASSLATVVGLFFVLAWVMKRAGPKGSRPLPGDVVEVLGRAPLAGRQQMHLLRCGGKLLLVSVTAETAETLTEITDPDEVTRLVSLCRQGQPGSTTAAFRQLLDQFGRQPVDSEFARPDVTAGAARPRSSVARKLGSSDG